MKDWGAGGGVLPPVCRTQVVLVIAVRAIVYYRQLGGCICCVPFLQCSDPFIQLGGQGEC